MAVYIHHIKKGPDFVWDQAVIARLLPEVRYRQGRFLGRIEGMGESLREEAKLQVHAQDLRVFAGPDGEGFVPLLLDTAEHYSAPLTRDRLVRYHAVLYPVAGAKAPESKSGVHFQTSAGVGSEDKLVKLIHWVNSAGDVDPVLTAAVAQLWLVLSRPFREGNERLGELVMEWLMARANQGGARMYSVSGQMRAEGREYAAILMKMRGGPPDVTPWLEWFLGCLGRALDSAAGALELILRKDRFWERCAGMTLNERQRTVLERFLDGRDNKLTSSKWAVLTKTSQDTAGRDINDLVRLGILTKEAGGGRSTSYRISS